MQTRSLTFEQVQVFRTVVQTGSFTKAAERLYLSQPAISQQIDHLERALGTKLFARERGHRLSLTASGSTLLEFASELDSLVDRLDSRLHQEDPTASHEPIRIACGRSIGYHVLPSILASIRDQCPGTQVQLIRSTPGEINDAVKSGKADLGIESEAAADSSLRKTFLTLDQLILVASPNHRLAQRPSSDISEVVQYPFVLPARDYSLRRSAEQWASTFGVQLTVAVECSPFDVIKEAVRYELGVSILPKYIVDDDLRQGLLKEIRAPGLPQMRRLCIVSNPAQVPSADVQVLLRALKRWGRHRTELSSQFHATDAVETAKCPA